MLPMIAWMPQKVATLFILKIHMDADSAARLKAREGGNLESIA
jgi:hypothetical protein